MKQGDKVKWVLPNGNAGSGMIIEGAWSQIPVNHWLVAVDAETGWPHQVIYCAETWLELVP